MIRRELSFMILSVLLLSVAVFGATPASSFSLCYNVVGIKQPAELVKADPGLTGIVPMDLTRGPGINLATLTNGFSADGWDKAQSRADSFAAGGYFQFGFTVQPDFRVSLSTLDLSLRRSALSAPMNVELQVSFDGFKTDGTIISEFNYYGRTSGTRKQPDSLLADPFLYMKSDVAGHPNTTTSPGDPIPTIDLTTFDMLQNIPEGVEVTFRLYAWGNTSTTGTNTLALGRMVGPRVEGTAAPK
jgi:hypothetical protein